MRIPVGTLPPEGAYVCLKLERLPEASYVVHVYLDAPDDADPAPHKIHTFAVYGKGRDAPIAEQPTITIPVKAEHLKRAPAGPHELLLLVESGDTQSADVTLPFAAPFLKPFHRT